jgi:hypothetical protein
MGYEHERATADGVNVDFEVYNIRTKITERGGRVEADAHTMLGYRNRQSRAMRWETAEDLSYDPGLPQRETATAGRLLRWRDSLAARESRTLFPCRMASGTQTEKDGSAPRTREPRRHSRPTPSKQPLGASVLHQTLQASGVSAQHGETQRRQGVIAATARFEVSSSSGPNESGLKPGDTDLTGGRIDSLTVSPCATLLDPPAEPNQHSIIGEYHGTQRA